MVVNNTEFSKNEVINKIRELYAVERWDSRKQYLEELEEAVICDEADEEAVIAIMEYEI